MIPKYKPRRPWEPLNDVAEIRAVDLLRAVEELIEAEGEDVRIVFDAGYNNITVELEGGYGDR